MVAASRLRVFLSLPCFAMFAAGLLETACPGQDAPEKVDVFVSGSGGYHTYRIPAVVITNRGTLLAFCEGRKTGRGDHGDVDLVMRRSTDGGKTWEPMRRIYEEGDTAPITIGNPCPVVDRKSGTVWLPFCRDNDRVLIMHSTDDGQTWSGPEDLTAAVKLSNWDWYATGPGHGIQLSDGRLVVPCDHRPGKKSDRVPSNSHVIYSDDQGKTWRLGGSAEPGTNECEVVERTDRSLLLSMRNLQFGSPKHRAFSESADGGLTWSKPQAWNDVHCPYCQSAIQRLTSASDGRSRIVYSGPGGPRRANMTLRLSYDEGRTWPVARVVHEGPAAYSDLVALPDKVIGCLYEAGVEGAYEKIVFVRCTLAWLGEK